MKRIEENIIQYYLVTLSEKNGGKAIFSFFRCKHQERIYSEEYPETELKNKGK